MSDLPWPQCLGGFDEESCRYFLNEVGSYIVPKFPFSFGMEEVHGLIVERYGLEGASDAISLLQQFFEDDDSAGGHGDDGDVWRSWRYGWRHRNDDALNPFIPHSGSIVLPAPTQNHIRQLKANNFTLMLQHRPGVPYEQTLGGHGLGEVLNTRETPAGPDVVGNGRDNDIQPQSSVVHSSSARTTTGACCSRRSWCMARFDPTLAAVCELRETRDEDYAQLQEDGKQSRSGGEEVVQRGSKKRNSRKLQRSSSAVTDSPRCLSGRPGSPTYMVRSPVSVSLSDDSAANTFNGASRTCWSSTASRRNSGTVSEDVAKKEDSVTAPADLKEDRMLTNRQSQSTPEHQVRAANREARLIDGTIFTSRSRRSKTIDTQQGNAAQSLGTSAKKILKRSSWSPSKQRDSLRSNWTRELRHLLHRDQKGAAVLEKRKRRSVLAPRKHDIPANLSKMPIPDSPCSDRATQQPVTIPGLDGSYEVPLRCDSSLDVNKPLPLNPEDVVRSMSSRTHTLTSAFSDAKSDPSSSRSTATSFSNTSSKRDLRGLTREALQSRTQSPHELFPIHEVDAHLKAAVEPQKSPPMTGTHMSYSSIARANPFTNKVAKSPQRPCALDLENLQPSMEGPELSPLVLTPENVSRPSSPLPLQTNIQAAHIPQAGSPKLERGLSTRGRTLKTSKPISGQNENPPPKTPKGRSRSPIKRFLGLVKSDISNKLETSEARPPATTPGSGSKKDSLKKWGDRIRYGFLTADQEQLRQEDLLEQHNNDSNSSTPQNSTFPISLGPPLQAKVQSEVELIMSVTINNYLLIEARAGRISAESVARTKELWEKMNRPQVVEFHYDSLTQHNLVMANLDRVRLHGDAAKDPIAINSTMRGWKTLAREMAVRTYCSPDSVIRKHLHDAHRVLELVGSPLRTIQAYEEMQLKTLSTINQRQQERVARRAGSHGRRHPGDSSQPETSPYLHRRNFSDGGQPLDHTNYPITAFQLDKISLSPTPAPFPQGRVRKVTGAEGAIMSLPTNFECSRNRNLNKSRDVRTGKEL